MSFGPKSDLNAATVDFAEIVVSYSEVDWYLAYANGSLFEGMKIVSSVLSEHRDGAFSQEFEAQSVNSSVFNGVGVSKLNAFPSKISFEPGSQTLTIVLSCSALVLASVSAIANYPKAKDNLPVLLEDAEKLKDKIISGLRGAAENGQPIEGLVRLRRGFSDIGKKLIEEFDRKQR